MLEQRLRDAVRLQSLADVPLGAFLSGGVDSSTIVALMQENTSRPVRTFTVGFEEQGFDESVHARAVARHLGTAHTEMYVSSADARAVIPLLPRMYDEPFADSSQVPTHLVCRAARQHVTVALSGDAGDELFGGYNRYFWGPRIWNQVRWLPFPLRRRLGAFIATIPVHGWDAANDAVGRLLPRMRAVSRVGDKAHKLAARLESVRQREDLYLTLVSEWQLPGRLIAGGVDEPPSLLADPLPSTGLTDERLRMMYRDSVTYLPDDILCKVDRAAMSVSLETRVPFLDHRVAELAWRLPLSLKIREGVGKWVLRQILYKYVPRELIDRPKSGFGVPVGKWLRGPLKEWSEDLLSESALQRAGYLEPGEIRQAWQQHLSGSRDWTHRIWSVLMFQSWLRTQE
jgi:asparagine synthase (glutamine-hydrolysing)